MKNNWTLKIIFAVCLCVFIGAGYFLVNDLMEYKKGDEIYNTIIQAAMTPQTNNGSQTDGEQNGTTGEGNSQAAEQWKPPVINFEELNKMNPDIVGWIAVENTDINYPLLKSKDNQEYLHLAANNQKNNSGSIFLDCRNQRDLTDNNIIIYGHNMKNGSMFGTLKEFIHENYTQNHKRFYILTPEKNYVYEIFSAYQTDTTSPAYCLNFNQDYTYKEFIEFVTEKSVVDTGVSVTPEDKVVTLSTCTNRAKTERYVVHGKLTEEEVK